MRINNRLIQHSQKSIGIKVMDSMQELLSSLADILCAIGNAIGNFAVAFIDAVGDTVSDVIHEIQMVQQYKAEDKELFSQLPSLRRFEHDMR